MNPLIEREKELNEPQIWHYGLCARDWTEFTMEAGEEAACFKRIIEASGEPALDLGAAADACWGCT